MNTWMMFARAVAGVAMAVMLSGCAWIAYMNPGDTIPEETQRMSYPWPIMNITRSDFVAIGTCVHDADKGGLIMVPYLICDTAFSFVADIVSCPWQINRYMNFPAEEDGSNATEALKWCAK